jgi:hypothetical protein
VTQRAGESLQDFATAVEQLAHRAYPTLPEDHIRREAGKAFTDGVEDHEIKVALLIGGKKTVNEALRQALELQAVFLAARSNTTSTKTFWESRSPPTQQRNARQSECWSCGESGHLESTCPYRRKAENDRRWKPEDRPNRDTRELPRKSEWRASNEETNRRVASLRENEEGPEEKGECRSMHLVLTVIMENADPSLVTQGWIGDNPCLVTVDTGGYVTMARPDIAAGLPERQLDKRFTLQMVSGEAFPILKEVFLTPTLGQHSLKIWLFVADITNGFILGLDILHAYDASVDIGRQMLCLVEEEVSFQPRIE